LDYREFRRHLGKAGFSVNQFAELLEVRPNSVSNYRRMPTVPRIYSLLAVLLGDCVDRGVDVTTLFERFRIVSRKEPAAGERPGASRD
jgi:predicted transcriptional regulator